MARDIASVAEKDTREADGRAGEAMPFPEVPRSEGGPATREPEPPADARGAVSPEPAPLEPVESHAEPSEPATADADGSDAPPSSFAPERESGEDPPSAVIPTAHETPDPTTEPPTELEPITSREIESEPEWEPDNVSVATAPPADPVADLSREVESEPEPAPDTAEPAMAPEPPLVDERAPEQDGIPDAVEATAQPAPPAVYPDEGTHDIVPDIADTESWRGAIAEALAEQPAAPSADVSEPEAALAPPAPEPEPVPAPELPDAAPDTAHAPIAAAPPDPATPDTPDPFTSAAADLFHPPEAKEEPHLITLGRRLDPTLRIPRPEVPDIAPRPEPAAVRPAPWWKTARWTDHLRTGLRYGAYAVAGYLALVLVLIVLFRFVNPPGSMLMLTQRLTGTSIERTWVPLSAISPHLVRAVIVSEDGRFCEHSGVDTAAIREAIERAARGRPRGASTISMQVTKNLFLWSSKSYVRKVIEIPLTLIMELVWPKRRVLEVYLNVAEWGPGTFGAEAAARRHFRKSAAHLSARESALLAAVLPNPLARDAGAPGPQTSAKARVVQARVRAYGAVASCVVSAAAPTPAEATPAVVKPRPARKPPAKRTAPARKKQPQQTVDDWAPILNFGPR